MLPKQGKNLEIKHFFLIGQNLKQFKKGFFFIFFNDLVWEKMCFAGWRSGECEVSGEERKGQRVWEERTCEKKCRSYVRAAEKGCRIRNRVEKGGIRKTGARG